MRRMVSLMLLHPVLKHIISGLFNLIQRVRSMNYSFLQFRQNGLIGLEVLSSDKYTLFSFQASYNVLLTIPVCMRLKPFSAPRLARVQKSAQVNARQKYYSIHTLSSITGIQAQRPAIPPQAEKGDSQQYRTPFFNEYDISLITKTQRSPYIFS